MESTSTFGLKFEIQHDFLLVHATGKRVRDMLFDMAVSIIEEVLKQKLKKILVDISQLTGHLNTINAYDLATKDLPTLKQVTRMKIALLDKHISDDLQFFETACRNIGLNIRVFTDKNRAIFWLRSNEYI